MNPEQLILTLKQWPPSREIKESLDNQGLRIVSELSIVKKIIVARNAASAMQSHASIGVMADAMKQHPEVSRARVDRTARTCIDRAIVPIQVPEIWRRGQHGAGIRVAVLDTGASSSNPMLVGAVAESRDYTGRGSVEDGNGHGNWCCSALAGRSWAPPNMGGAFLQGIASKAELVVLKVLTDAGSGSFGGILTAMSDAAERFHCHGLSMSLGGPGDLEDDDLVDMVEALARMGVWVCAAAGNDGPQRPYATSPGMAPSAITVGATTIENVLASFSSGGSTGVILKPDVSAPGVALVAPWNGATTRAVSGTSMATPIVAGVVAAIQAAHVPLKARPGSPEIVHELKARVMATAKLVTRFQDGVRGDAGMGVVQAADALLATVIEHDGRSRPAMPPPEDPIGDTPPIFPCADLFAEGLKDPLVQLMISGALQQMSILAAAGIRMEGLDKMRAGFSLMARELRAVARPGVQSLGGEPMETGRTMAVEDR